MNGGGVVGAPPVAPLDAPVAARPRRRGPWIAGVLTLAAVVVLAVVVASGGSRHDGRSALQVLTVATARTTAGTVHVDAVERFDDGGPPVELRGSADEDLHDETSRATFTFGASDPTKIEIRLVHGDLYESFGGTHLPHGAHWVHTPDAERALRSGPRLGSSDPTSGLEFLAAAKRDPRVIGHPTISGDRTTEYSFEIDLAAALVQAVAQRHEKLSADDRGALGSLRHVPARAWIDGSGHVRRFSVSVAVTEGGRRTRESMVVDFSRFGEHFGVSKPAAGDTISAAEYRAYQRTHPDS